MSTKLKRYFEKTGMTKQRFGEKVGINESSVYNLLAQKHLPNLVLAFKIEEVTNGKVKAKDFYNEYKSQKLSGEGYKRGPQKVPARIEKSSVRPGNRRRKNNNIHKTNKRPLRARPTSSNRGAKKKLS